MTVKDNPVDFSVGQRIRFKRWQLGVSQTTLGEFIGVRFQQIQKYETGTNRISASRLWDVSKLLQEDVGYFFQDLHSEKREPPDSDLLRCCGLKETAELMQCLTAMSPDRREMFRLLVREMAAGGGALSVSAIPLVASGR